MANKKIWRVAEKIDNDLFRQILKTRKIKNVDEFLNPNYERDLSDPLEIKGMKKAVARFKKALRQKQKIALFGDYDADGIPAAAILFETMKFLKTDLPKVFIPHREDGYGLKEKHLLKIIAAKVNLLITIDCGITNIKEINFLREKNIETIIIDHHLPKEKLPQAIIVDPKQSGEIARFRDLSAGGLVWKFCWALLSTPGVNPRGQPLGLTFLKWILDLAAITTICDLVPLVNENRTIAYFGLKVLRKNRRLGLKILNQIAGINTENITPSTVGFQIGPRINAAGRMAGPEDAFQLLTTDDKKEAEELAEKLNKVNLERQKKLDQIIKEAERKIEEQRLDEKKIILLAKRNWPLGLIGLAASKIQEKYYRPTFILSKKEKTSRGSVRSQNGFNIIEALDKIKNYLISYGGHAKAAGLEIENKKIEKFYHALLNVADKILKEKYLQPVLKIDAVAEKLNDFNIGLFEKITKMEPFGIANPKPIFAIKNIRLADCRLVGREKKHLKCLVYSEREQGIPLNTIFFDGGVHHQKIAANQKFDLAFNLSLNEWGGKKKIELNIIDYGKNL